MKDITYHFQFTGERLQDSISNLSIDQDYEIDFLKAVDYDELHRKLGIAGDILTARGYTITSSLKGKRKILFKKG